MGLALALAALILLVCAAIRRTQSALPLAACLLAIATALTAVIMDGFSLSYWPLAPVIALVGGYLATCRVLQSALALKTARVTDAMSGLPNRYAMIELRDKLTQPRIAVARIADFEQLELVIHSNSVFEIDKGVAGRLAMLAHREKVFRIKRGLFGWFIPLDQGDNLASYFDTARAMLNAPLTVEGRPLKLAANFGSSIESIEDAISASEHAHRTGTSWSSVALDMQENSQIAQQIMLELDDALENGAIWVAYQPKYRFADQTISGAECLVRWDSPNMGKIGPEKFIPVLEGKSRMQELTLVVIRDALRRLKEAEAVGRTLNLAVNVSAQLLVNTPFVDMVVDLLKAHCAICTNGLTIEITESAPLADSSIAKEALTKLRSAGGRISIDDYGTGQATLTYLQGFPASEVKLDQSFVKSFTSSKSDEIMVRSTIEMAHALGFEIVAEGIEDGEILDALAALGCDYGQGWHIGKPVPWNEFVMSHLSGTQTSEAA